MFFQRPSSLGVYIPLIREYFIHSGYQDSLRAFDAANYHMKQHETRGADDDCEMESKDEGDFKEPAAPSKIRGEASIETCNDAEAAPTLTPTVLAHPTKTEKMGEKELETVGKQEVVDMVDESEEPVVLGGVFDAEHTETGCRKAMESLALRKGYSTGLLLSFSFFFPQNCFSVVYLCPHFEKHMCFFLMPSWLSVGMLAFLCFSHFFTRLELRGLVIDQAIEKVIEVIQEKA